MEAIQIQEIEAIADLMEQDEDQEAKKKINKDETQILEKTIINIGALMAIGFGEAGSQIISQNMEKGGDVNPMIPGRKIYAIFGFCDIHNFSAANEVLQEVFFQFRILWVL